MLLQLSEHNYCNGGAWKPQPPMDGSCFMNTEKIIVPAPGRGQVMKPEAAVKLEWYGNNEVHLLKIIMQWSHRDLSSLLRH